MIENKLNFLNETRYRLRAWGRWSQRLLTMGLDYSGQSIIRKILDHKNDANHPHHTTFIPNNPEAEEIELFINEYANIFPEKARVLSVHYAMQGNAERKIFHARVPKRTYYRYLAEAEDWLNQKLFSN